MKKYISKIIEICKALFEKSDRLIEMANLTVEDTGLSRGWIRVSTQEGKHGARVKYYRDRPSRRTPSASISISPNPEVKEDSVIMTAKEIKEIFTFVIKNHKTLIKMWNEGESMDKKEWFNLVNSLEKI